MEPPKLDPVDARIDNRFEGSSTRNERRLERKNEKLEIARLKRENAMLRALVNKEIEG